MEERETKIPDGLKSKVLNVPHGTGVYIMKDASGKVIYVGKAKDLKNRVRSYFGNHDTRPMIPFLVPKIHDLDFIMTDTEKEALILENSLIKEYRPRYNVFFRDDKDYYHLRIAMDHPYPRFQLVRRPKKDGALYFGPYSSALAIKETLNYLQSIFPLRTCKDIIFKTRTRPCIEYEIKRCLGPCKGLVGEKQYGEMVSFAVSLLDGKEKKLLKDLKYGMREAAGRFEYEEAARLRDIILAIEATIEKQKVMSPIGDSRDQDIFGIFREGNNTLVCAIRIKKGRIQGTKKFPVFKLDIGSAEILSSVLKQFYADEPQVPEDIILPFEIEEKELISDWLSGIRGGRAALIIPQRGKKRELLEMAQKNAENLFKAERDFAVSVRDTLEAIAGKLHLKRVPERIECFDISNIGGEGAVGSLVCFRNGVPEKERYRRFRIRETAGPDDYGMLYEVLKRRFVHTEELPDLIMIDGGKGQLNAALAAMRESAVDVDIIGFAKEAAEDRTPHLGQPPPGKRSVRKTEDRVYLAGRKDPVYLTRNPRSLLLLQSIRDEAHRFAISSPPQPYAKEGFALDSR